MSFPTRCALSTVTMELAKRTTIGPEFFNVSNSAAISVLFAGPSWNCGIRSSAFIARQFNAGPSTCSTPSIEPANCRRTLAPGAVASHGFSCARSTCEKLNVAAPGYSPSRRHSPSPFTTEPATVDSRCARSASPCELAVSLRVAQRLALELHALRRDIGVQFVDAVSGLGWPVAVPPARWPSPGACPSFRDGAPRPRGFLPAASRCCSRRSSGGRCRNGPAGAEKLPLTRTCFVPAASIPLVTVSVFAAYAACAAMRSNGSSRSVPFSSSTSACALGAAIVPFTCAEPLRVPVTGRFPVCSSAARSAVPAFFSVAVPAIGLVSLVFHSVNPTEPWNCARSGPCAAVAFCTRT